MSSKLTSVCDSNNSDSLPSVIHGYGVFDNLRELSEEKEGVPCVESATARSTRCQFCNLGKRNHSQANHRFPDSPRRLWISIKKGGRFGLEAPVDEPPPSDSSSVHSNLTGYRMRGVKQWTNTRSSWANPGGPIPPPQGNPIGVAPEVPIFVTRKDGRLGKLKGNLVVQDENSTDAEGSDELDGEELEINTPIQKRRIQSTSLSPVPVSITIHEVIRSPQLDPQPGHPHLPLPPSIFNHLWPALLETQFLKNLNQSFTTFDAEISLETSLIRIR
ncbi:hypothetical protein O181_056077 [Austropuccinia psidii MF-1]|uniref:Uncharacterized protein n=1 Tax=Austropuccinia psidii MF-1 TaxID=1389203 RepID=A0A9Q3EEZ7_9BASI|nr:hypothetical protein [Austropuccinia psidii MF-1]